ncbi:CD5 antigen-like [Pseudorasbora parva]|uniref:CD5 antigen-like n=1 Tax=Pseudorasbora parva TaxID=51549 RepID=UPI00351E48DC
MLYAIWLILLQVLGNSASVEAGVRLIDGSNFCSGRVQVLYQGKWLSVCYVWWGLLESNVVCRELGCGLEAEVVAYSGEDLFWAERSWVKQPKCSGNELSLTKCPVTSQENVKDNSCPQDLYAGVICHSDTTRLVSGSNSCSGRVEVFYNGQWGTVCDNGWDLADAAVVCRERGCGDAVEAKTAAYFGQGSGPVLINLVDCLGNEAALKQCNLDRQVQNNITHLQDAGVICSGGIIDTIRSPGSPSSVKMLLRIEVKTDSNINPNDPAIISKLSEEMSKLQLSGPFMWTWKTQSDGKVFQKGSQKKKVSRTTCK